MATIPRLVVLHGMAMSGAGVLRAMAPLAAALEVRGWEITAPNGSKEMSRQELSGFHRWLSSRYASGDRKPMVEEPRTWRPNHHYDWLDVETDEGSGEKTYRALEASLEQVAQALRGAHRAALFGFSQGALLSMIITALALAGDERFAAVRSGIFLAGFVPECQHPIALRYPIRGNFRALFAIGSRDPLYLSGVGDPQRVAQALVSPHCRTMVIDGLRHQIPVDSESIKRFVGFLDEKTIAPTCWDLE